MTTRTKIILAVVALLVLGGAAYWYFSKKEKPEEDAPDKPAPKTPEPKTVMARESSGYPNTSATMQDIPVSAKISARSEPVSFVKVAQNPPPRVRSNASAGTGLSVKPTVSETSPKIVKLTATNSTRGGATRSV
jgi:hypothetical protein